jgi:hypothetical protein
MSKKDPQAHVYPDPDGAAMSVALTEGFLESSTSEGQESEEEVTVAGAYEQSS